MDLKLFPKGESWATGDEAIDLKLTNALKETAQDLSIKKIQTFYEYGISIRPRAYNPLFNYSIETVVKALLAIVEPTSFNDHLLKKIKSDYYAKNVYEFELAKSDIIIDGLKMMSKFRYEEQVDFYIFKQAEFEKNPYLSYELIRSPIDLQVKIIFKEFKEALSQKKELKSENLFFHELRAGKILKVKNLGEFWFHEDQIYSTSLLNYM